MIIEKIEIKSFGALTDTVMEFTEKVNVIEGQNEAGKSTIAAFLKYMLFGFGASESDATERDKRISWSTGRAEGSMVVRVKGKRYLITRNTVPTKDSAGRDAYKEDSSIVDMDSGTTSFGKLPAGEVFFGVTGELFENTAFVGQVGDSAINEGSVKASIENILFSGNERMNNQRAIAKINERMEGLLHRGGQGGVIPDLVRRRDELALALERSNEDNKQMLAKETELYRIKQERSESAVRLEKLRDLDECYKNVMIIQTFDQLYVLEEENVQKAEAYVSFINENTHAGYVPNESYLSDISLARTAHSEAARALAEADEAYARERSAAGITREIESMIELSDSLGGEAEVLAGAKRSRISFMRNILFAILTALFAIAALVYEIASKGPAAELIWRISVGALGGISIIGTVIFLVLLLRDNKRIADLAAKFGVGGYRDLSGKISVIKDAREKRDGMIVSTEQARVNAEQRRIDYENAKSELTRVIVRWGDVPPVSGLDEFLDRLVARVSAFLERKNILFEEKNSIELTVREIRRTLADKNEIDIRAQVPPMKRKVLSNINHDDIISGIAALKSRIAECERDAFSVESELVALRARAVDPVQLRIKIATLDERIKELRDRHKSYFIALKAIESASDNLRAGISPRLGEYATELMSVMTDKKYSRFAVSNGMKVTFTAEDGAQRSVDLLSGGTRDLAYVAVRMALIDMLYGEKPPICFDETFAHQDNIRARSLMRALSHLSEEGYQSFIFTCREREGILATEMVEGSGVYQLSDPEVDIA